MIEINKVYNNNCFNIFQLINDKSVDLILCDLPYETINALDWDKKLDLNKLWVEYKRILKDNGLVILTAVQPFTSELVMSNLEWFKYELIWEKERLTNIFLVNKRVGMVHENILIFYKKQPTYNPQMINVETKGVAGWHKTNLTGDVILDGQNDRTSKTHKNQKYRYSKNFNPNKKHPTSVIKIKRDNSGAKGKSFHPTQKPVKLFEWLIKSYTNENDLVLDNCSGSGTTAIACINTNRNYICIEKDKEYYIKSLQRINARNS